LKLIQFLPKRLAIGIKEYELRHIRAKLEYYTSMVHSLTYMEHEITESILEMKRK